MGEADVQRALERLARLLDQHTIPYAVIGAMALNEWGYRRVTVGIDVLLSAEGLRALKDAALGRGYVEKFPGDGEPKPVAFPDPADAAVRGRRVALLPRPKLIELKLASGMTAPHRLKDLADVLELIRAVELPIDLDESLDSSVRGKYRELWEAAQSAPDDK